MLVHSRWITPRPLTNQFEGFKILSRCFVTGKNWRLKGYLVNGSHIGLGRVWSFTSMCPPLFRHCYSCYCLRQIEIMVHGNDGRVIKGQHYHRRSGAPNSVSFTLYLRVGLGCLFNAFGIESWDNPHITFHSILLQYFIHNPPQMCRRISSGGV